MSSLIDISKDTPDAYRQYNDECEREAFLRHQGSTKLWAPTRDLLESHILSQIDRNGLMRARATVALVIGAVNSVALVVLALVIGLSGI